MDISIRFNRFYHSILNDLHKKSNSLVIRELIDTRTGGAFKLVKYEDWTDMDELKQLLKILNLDYKVVVKNCFQTPLEYLEEKQSTKDIDNKELLKHIEWIFRTAANNGISLQFIEDEWRELINYYKDK